MILASASLFIIGLGVRHYLLMAYYGGSSSGSVPFAQESALQMRRVKMILDRGCLPLKDHVVSSPSGVVPAKEYTVLVDYLQATISRLVGDTNRFIVNIRWIESALFCFSIPLLFLCCWFSTASISAGIAGSLIYAASISAVQRSTGAELSTENTAFLFLAAHLMFRARWFSKFFSHVSTINCWASAFCFALALASWDLMQLYAMIWAGIGLWNIVLGKWSSESKEVKIWRLEFAALVILAAVSPYHRAHGFIVSPAIILSVIGMSILLFRCRANFATTVLLLVFLGSAFMAYKATSTGGEFIISYGHFGELLLAKIRYLNMKPENPLLLTFQQRLLWTPALHSPTLQLTFEIVGLLLVTCIPSAFVIARSAEGCLSFGSILVAFAVALIGYIFFFRLHVFLVLFGSLLVASRWSLCFVSSTRKSVLGRTSLVSCVFLAAVHTMYGPWGAIFADRDKLERELDGRPAASLWGSREGIYHQEQVELTDWLAKNISPETVLAGFGLSGPIASYGKCSITLHPKFETGAAREKVREYAEQLFCGSLESFRAWADFQGASYFVYGLGSFSAIQPTLQLRYIVNSINPYSDSPARIFEEARSSGPFFRQVFANRKYKVYKILTTGDEIASSNALLRALKAFEAGSLDVAEREATFSLKLNPSIRKAEDILMHVEALRGRGFSSGNE